MDTIVALATGSAPAGVAIVRLSGSEALACARRLARLPDPMPPRQALLVAIVHPHTRVQLDEAIVLYFRGPASFTGEDVVEIQGHGGMCHVEAMLEAAYAAGARAAEPGEFSRRAVLQGRMTLERAEAAADLATAETSAALAAARAQLFGAVGQAVEAIVADALSLRAEVEATLDFPGDVDESPPDLDRRAAGLAQRCQALLATFRLGRALKEGVRVVLAGAPNAGKSSLFNALLGESRAIVDEDPGTTRDALEGRLDLEGVPCVLVDTAGLREAAGRVEARGIERARAEIARGGLCLWVLDATGPVALPENLRGGDWLEVVNKSDLREVASEGVGLRVSARTGAGIGALKEALAERIRGEATGAAGGALITNRRHAELLEKAAHAFEQAAAQARQAPLEMVAYDLHEGARALDRIVGRGVNEALLDEIFARFCIGK